MIEIKMDHKPLVPMFSNKGLHGLPPHVLRFLFRLDRYDYRIQCFPGKLLYAADTLSHAPVSESVDALELEEEILGCVLSEAGRRSFLL